MPKDTVKPGADTGGGFSRREVLRVSLAAALLALSRRAGAQDAPRSPASQPTLRPTSVPTTAAASQPVQRVKKAPWWMSPDRPRSRVVQVSCARALQSGHEVDGATLGEMLEVGIQDLTRTRTPRDAWRTILGDARRIVVKFNHVGADVLATNEVFARTIVDCLSRGGYPPESIALVEIPRSVAEDLGTRTPIEGWGAPIVVGETEEELANYLYDGDAVINVPLLKTHQVAGMSGAMKNLSHAVIRHPARYHANGCSPYVGQIIGNEEVSSRLRLNVVNALRTIVRHGPDAKPEDVVDFAGVLLSFDPVAADTVGQGILLSQRQQLGIAERLEVPYLEAAAQAGVGRRALHQLECVPSSYQ